MPKATAHITDHYCFICMVPVAFGSVRAEGISPFRLVLPVSSHFAAMVKKCSKASSQALIKSPIKLHESCEQLKQVKKAARAKQLIEEITRYMQEHQEEVEDIHEAVFGGTFALKGWAKRFHEDCRYFFRLPTSHMASCLQEVHTDLSDNSLRALKKSDRSVVPKLFYFAPGSDAKCPIPDHDIVKFTSWCGMRYKSKVGGDMGKLLVDSNGNAADKVDWKTKGIYTMAIQTCTQALPHIRHAYGT